MQGYRRGTVKNNSFHRHVRNRNEQKIMKVATYIEKELSGSDSFSVPIAFECNSLWTYTYEDDFGSSILNDPNLDCLAKLRQCFLN